MNSPKSIEPGLNMLDAVDRLARATDRWVQSGVATGQFSSIGVVPEARQELAAGIISGLCEALELDRHHQLFALYIYVLLNDAVDLAADTATGLCTMSGTAGEREHFHRGRAEAVTLIDLLHRPIN
jgi:hypothetical protein